MKDASQRWGCLGRITRPGESPYPNFGEVKESPLLIPEADWGDFAIQTTRPFVDSIIDQGPIGSCCGCATVQSLMVLRHRAGLPHILLSEASIYGPGSGGRDQGMTIEEGIRLLSGQGAVPADVIDPRDWRGYWNKSWPSGWRDIAKDYRATEWFELPTHNHMVSAVLSGWPVVFGVMWPGGGGHAIVGYGYDPIRDVWKIVNSWGSGWGDAGFGELDRRTVDNGSRTFGAWAPAAMIDPAGQGDVPALEE